MSRYNGILWKIKEEVMMTENCADILRGSLDPADYRLACDDFAIHKEAKFCEYLLFIHTADRHIDFNSYLVYYIIYLVYFIYQKKWQLTNLLVN